MRHYFRFLLSTADEDATARELFCQHFRKALGERFPNVEMNLYTTMDYREKILSEKLQRIYIECTDDGLPLLHNILRSFPNIEVDPPPVEVLLCVAGTSHVERLPLLSVLN